MAPLISGATRCVFSMADMGGSGSLDTFHIEQERGEGLRFNYINEGIYYGRIVHENA